MENTVLISLVGVLSFSSAALAVNCTDQNSVQEAQAPCFAPLNISVNIKLEDLQDLQNLHQYNPSTLCRHPGLYKTAMACSFEISRECLRNNSVPTTILPDSALVGRGIDYMCQHQSEVDVDCVLNSSPMLKRCAMDKVNTQMNDLNITEDVKDIVCAGYRSGYECMKDTLGQCSGRTREIYLEMTNKYTRPLACSPFDPISYEPATGPGGGAWILHDTVGAILMLLFGTAVIYVVV